MSKLKGLVLVLAVGFIGFLVVPTQEISGKDKFKNLQDRLKKTSQTQKKLTYTIDKIQGEETSGDKDLDQSDLVNLAEKVKTEYGELGLELSNLIMAVAERVMELNEIDRQRAREIIEEANAIIQSADDNDTKAAALLGLQEELKTIGSEPIEILFSGAKTAKNNNTGMNDDGFQGKIDAIKAAIKSGNKVLEIKVYGAGGDNSLNRDAADQRANLVKTAVNADSSVWPVTSYDFTGKTKQSRKVVITFATKKK